MEFRLEILKKYINNSPMTHDEIAEGSNISIATYFRKIKNGNLTVGELCAIVNTLGLSKDQVLSILGL